MVLRFRVGVGVGVGVVVRNGGALLTHGMAYRYSVPAMVSVFHVGNHPDTQPLSALRPQMAHGVAAWYVRMSWSGFSSGMGRGRLLMSVVRVGARHRRRARHGAAGVVAVLDVLEWVAIARH